MRLGGEVYRWKTAEEWAQRHVEKGYGAAIWPLGVDASELDEEDFVRAAKRHDLVIAEVGVWRNLFGPNEKAAADNEAYCIARMKQADRVGARCCVNTSGSLSQTWFGPHRDNMTEKTFRRIVETTCRMLEAAQMRHSCYCLESAPWMYPMDASSMAALLQAVDRPDFAVHVDMVNMINSPEKIYRTGELTREYFQAFAPMIRSVHVKDIAIRDDLTLYMPEVVCGEGEFDHETLLQECARLEDVPMIVEHLPDEATYDKAVSHLRGIAQRLGLAFDTGR